MEELPAVDARDAEVFESVGDHLAGRVLAVRALNEQQERVLGKITVLNVLHEGHVVNADGMFLRKKVEVAGDGEESIRVLQRGGMGISGSRVQSKKRGVRDGREHSTSRGAN